MKLDLKLYCPGKERVVAAISGRPAYHLHRPALAQQLRLMISNHVIGSEEDAVLHNELEPCFCGEAVLLNWPRPGSCACQAIAACAWQSSDSLITMLLPLHAALCWLSWLKGKLHFCQVHASSACQVHACYGLLCATVHACGAGQKTVPVLSKQLIIRMAAVCDMCLPRSCLQACWMSAPLHKLTPVLLQYFSSITNEHVMP